MEVFDHYAKYYDLLYKDKDYRGEAKFVLSLLNRFASNGHSILELGCGTGIHAQLFAEAGYLVHGIDLSQTMLAAANRRRDTLEPAIRERLKFSEGDVRRFRAAHPVDVVLSLFHVFSYQASNRDLQDAFVTAAQHLQPGGTFIFDYWYGPAVLAQRPEVRIKRLKDGHMEILRIAEPLMDEQKNVVQVNYETQVRSHDQSETIHESHRMRYMFLPEIDLLAQLNGLEPVGHYEWLSERLPSSGSWAAFSVLRKR